MKNLNKANSQMEIREHLDWGEGVVIVLMATELLFGMMRKFWKQW